MKLLLVRHGESTANANGVLSSYPGDEVFLTELGRVQARQLSLKLSDPINFVYVSPLKRTIETAEIVFENRTGDISIDPRIKEVDYGNYSGHPNNAELDSIREMQVQGNYMVRFGGSGENKLDVLNRLYDFLIDVLGSHEEGATVLAVTHGSIISRIESILVDAGVVKKQNGVKNAEIREYALQKTDIDKLVRLKKLDNLLATSEYAEEIFQYRDRYAELAADTKDPEVNLEVFEKFLEGLCTSRLMPLAVTNIETYRDLDSQTPVVVCAVHNSSLLIEMFIDHYTKIGVRHFVFIDNNSDDESVDTIKMKSKGLSVDIWQTDDTFDSFKAMGWKQRMFYLYGVDRWYINLDIDELLVFEGYDKGQSIRDFIVKLEQRSYSGAGSILVDMYSNSPAPDEATGDDILNEYRFFDIDTYDYDDSGDFGRRVFGGPRTRLIGRHPSLQKTPLVYVTESSIAINPHFWIPYDISRDARLCTALLHYKFLPGDLHKYQRYVDTGVHWDNSSQYRSYVEYAIEHGEVALFYSREHSGELNSFESVEQIRYMDGSRVIEPLAHR